MPPPASATAPAPQTPAPAPAVDHDTKPTHILITAKSIQILNDEGIPSQSFTYFQPVETLVAGLTALFGVEPVTTPYEGTTDVDYD